MKLTTAIIAFGLLSIAFVQAQNSTQNFNGSVIENGECKPACREGSVVLNGVCKDSCPEGYTNDNGVCRQKCLYKPGQVARNVSGKLICVDACL